MQPLPAGRQQPRGLRPGPSQKGPAAGTAAQARSPHRRSARRPPCSGRARFPGGEGLAARRARAWEPRWAAGARRCLRPSSRGFGLCAGSSLPSFGSWSCSLWAGSVFLIVLRRNLLFVPARGHFILRAKRESRRSARALQSRARGRSGPRARLPRKQGSGSVQLSLRAT